MAISAYIARPLFHGFIAGGFETITVEMRHVLVNVSGGALYANQSGIEYAIWPAGQLGSLGAPTLKGNAGTTNASGELVVDASAGFSIGDEVIVAVRKAAGAAGGSDDIWGIGSDVISAA